MSPLRHHTGNQRHAALVQHVREPLDGDCLKAWIRKDHFIVTLRGRITIEGGLDVRLQQLPNHWDASEKMAGAPVGLCRHVRRSILLRSEAGTDFCFEARHG